MSGHAFPTWGITDFCYNYIRKPIYKYCYKVKGETKPMFLKKLEERKAFLAENKKGFSLIELMIVVVIIAILAAIGMSSGATYVDESKVTKAEAEAATVQIALSQYNIDNPTAKITNTTQLRQHIASNGVLVTKGYLQRSPYFNGKDGCNYNLKSNGLSGANLDYHVYIDGCKFVANGGQIGIYVNEAQRGKAVN